MNKRVTLAALLSLFTVLPVMGQTTPAAPAKDDDVVKISTNLVQVDAVVTKDSKVVPNLTADDFEIYEDGKRQTITSFAFISNVPGGNAPAAAPKGGVEAPPMRIERDAQRRTIAVVVDDLGMSAESMNQVRKRLQKFIAEEIQPNDLVAVIRTSGQMGALQQFTNDKRLLNRAVNQLRWNVCSRLGQTVLTPAEGLGISSCYPDSVSITLRALRFILNSMANLPGRKSLILMSDSIPIHKEDSNGTGIAPIDDTAKIGMKTESFDPQVVTANLTNYGSWLRRLSETAIRSSVVIYSIDTQGLQYTGIAANDAISGKLPQKIPEFSGVAMGRSRSLDMNREGSEQLAKQTGGFQVHNSNDFELDRVLEDQRGYYLLGYRPTDETFNRQFHQIKAKVKRSGLTVRTRFGFWGISQEAVKAARPVVDQTNLALTSPFAAQDLDVEVNSFFAGGNTGDSIIRSFLYLNPAHLSFVPNNGRYETGIEMHGVIFGDNGAVVDKVRHDIVLSLGENEYKQAMRDGLPDAVRLRFDMPVKQPGSYQVRIAVRDRTSKKIGSAGQFIEVPDLNNKRLALSGIVLRSAGAATTPATVMATPPGRRFPVNSDLYFSFFLYNATPSLALQTKLFRDGKVVKATVETPVDATTKDNLGRSLITNVMRLTPDLEPGDYYLQVLLIDKAAKKPAAATQWVEFEIVK